MQNNSKQVFERNTELGATNISYIEELYEKFLQNPDNVSTHWKRYFSDLVDHQNASSEALLSQIRDKFAEYFKTSGQNFVAPNNGMSPQGPQDLLVKVEELIQAFREFGHYQASLDPLKFAKIPKLPNLEPEFYRFSPSDYQAAIGPTSFSKTSLALKDLLQKLRNTYCGNIGFEFGYIANIEEKNFLQEKIEKNQPSSTLTEQEKKRILQSLIWAEEFERFLSAKYVGQTRFSLEGGCSLIPMLDFLVQESGNKQVKELIIGMGHRGRLSVLVNILGKPLAKLFSEFAKKPENNQNGFSGDVKYHAGFSANIKTEKGLIHAALAFNPSHLEIINPVVEGAVRARQDRRGDIDRFQVIPVLIHGDAAFAGQGVVMETFGMSQTPGYTTGGTIHIVVNNQIGFTTSNPKDSRSSVYCSDIAKMVQAPVFHVNGDDPEACVYATLLALEYRMLFKKDVVIDLVCYRRLGHNEADEPMATQPEMYKIIRQYPRTWEIYLSSLTRQNIVTQNDAEQEISKYRDILDHAKVLIETIPNEQSGQIFADWRKYKDQPWHQDTVTSLPLTELKQLGEKLTTLPDSFQLQAQVGKEYENRREMIAGKSPFNWGFAEALAFASLLKRGYAVRLSGQDCGRGTFAHRHAVLHDQQNGERYLPLQNIDTHQAKFTVIDSLLSEEGVLGFEYGFATTDPEYLVIWEAQYGDFVNGAQVVIDQFITSGEQKWSRLCGLVMFLPHGYEGAGPEHSSARLERFLQSCAQKNIQVCIPSLPSQMFHMLRRQMLRPYRKPLIVMTHKSLLRNKLSFSELSEFTDGNFKLIIPEIDPIPQQAVKRIVLCSGKIYYDLLKYRREENLENVVLIRLEQLYPFPTELLKKELEKYKEVHDIVWCQEEPKNQGSWYSIHHRLIECLTNQQKLNYIGRPASASPATGYAGVHMEEQNSIVREVFEIK